MLMGQRLQLQVQASEQVLAVVTAWNKEMEQQDESITDINDSEYKKFNLSSW